MYETEFKPLWDLTSEITIIQHKEKHNKSHKLEGITCEEQKFRKLFYEITDNIKMLLEVRFSSFSKLEFFDLLNCEKFNHFHDKSNFPDSLIRKLIDVYGNMIDSAQLKTELSVLYSWNEITGLSP